MSVDDNAALAALLKHGHREGDVYVLDAHRCPAAMREAVQAWGHARGWVHDHVSTGWQVRVPAKSINRPS
jgi:hypothetical protein